MKSNLNYKTNNNNQSNNNKSQNSKPSNNANNNNVRFSSNITYDKSTTGNGSDHLEKNWIECWQAKNASCKLSFEYHPCPVLDWNNESKN